MMPGLDPKKMQALMKQMGIKQEDIDASRVLIEKSDGNKIIIDNPSVVKINMSGNESFQITGNVREESEDEGNLEKDINIVMERTGASEEEARKALEDADGDLTEAILELGG
ncbi:MAG TPA: nascent polypeptide-associated complex protein [Candidatus Nanoarchaeia archaeon]|nr:nascent polypeptide-associated complex protein [Candidatus Nanoarchaeia archaeon]